MYTVPTPSRKGWGVAIGAATMVLKANLTADDRWTRRAGRVGPWPAPSDPPSPADQSLSSLAGSAKFLKATTVNAGEGS